MNTQIIWIIFIKILENVTNKKKIFTLFYDMSADMVSNKGIYPIYTEVFLEEEN